MSLIALGSFALVGLQVAGPDMRKTGRAYFDSLHVADISIIGDYGIDEENIATINKVSGAEKIEYGYLKDVVIDGDSIRVFSLTDGISEYEIIDGRLPENDDEIAVASFYSDTYPIGSTVKTNEKADISGDTVLKNSEPKVVGHVNSSELLSIINMGQSTAGTGELKGYAVVCKEAFDWDVYTIARISFTDTQGVDPYSDEYTSLLQAHKDELDSLLADQPALRLDSVKEGYQKQIDETQAEINKAKKELSDAEEQLKKGDSDLSDAKQEYNNGLTEYKIKKEMAESQLEKSKNELDSASKQLSDAENEIQAKRKELADAEKQLQAARVTLDEGQKEYEQGVKDAENAKAELDDAEKKVNILVKAAETETGMSIDEIERSLPGKKSELDGLSAKYSTLSNLYELKKKRDRAVGTDEFDELNAKYRSALKDAGLTEASALVQYAQMPALKAEISVKSAEYERLKTAVDANNEYKAGLNEYNAAVLKLEQAKASLENEEKEYAEKSKELESAKVQLSQAESSLTEKEQEYRDGVKQYNEAVQEAETEFAKAENTLNDAKKQIDENEQTLNEKWAEFNEKKPDADAQIADAENEVEQAQDMLNKLKSPVYALDTRREVPGSEGYKIYTTVSNIVDSLADVFPIFLYFVAALVTLTTMTRFVDEERINSGTLKALGYNDRDIIKKFTLYGFSASLTGAVIGIAAGHTLLPIIVYNAYGKSFTYPQIELSFYPVISVIALVLAFVCAVVPAYIVAKKELKEKPSALLQPKPPESGSKILLERITPIWNRLNFTHKVTARNIFRYKKRMLMTVFGVCGSVTLIFAGFSVQHSVSGIKTDQFGKILNYDLIVAENSGVTQKQRENIIAALNEEETDKSAPIYYESVTKTAGKHGDKQEIKLIAGDNLDEFISLTDKNEDIDLAKSGCVISERLAELLNVKKGDTVTFYDSENKPRTVKVGGICKMYVGHFIFMNTEEYENVYSDDFEANAYFVTLRDRSTENAQNEASRFMELKGVKSVVQNTTMMNQIDTIVESLNRIMDILIIVAIMLAAVILYNLNNINVSERIRELSTIKVLGFYNGEVTLYIYRETILLTLLGIVVGYGFGDILFRYIINVVPPDEVMFNPNLGVKAFVIPVIVVGLITLILGFSVNKRMKKVNMLEALKSVE